MTPLIIFAFTLVSLAILWAWIPRLPRQLAAETLYDLRWYRLQARFPKTLCKGSKRLLILTSVLGFGLILSRPDAPLTWLLMSLVLNATLIGGALMDHQTGLLPFLVSLILGAAASVYQTIIAPDQLASHIWLCLVSACLLSMLNILTRHTGRGPALGGGDIAFLAALAWLFTPLHFAWLIFAAACFGLIESRLLKRQGAIRFGPNLSASAALLWYALPS